MKNIVYKDSKFMGVIIFIFVIFQCYNSEFYGNSPVGVLIIKIKR